MNSDRPLSALHCRPASRRLHRRQSFAASPVCAPRALATPSPPVALPRTLLSLSETVVREAGMFELLAAEMRIAELEKALAEAQQAAASDALTGVLNRRGFGEAFEREQARCRRRGGALALALIDLDDFKSLNDSLGHHAGDQALIHLVQVLSSALRPTDVLARFGGEEFVVLLPETSLADAQATVVRLQRRLAARPLAADGARAALTFSAGIAAGHGGESFESLLARADAATYAAKRAGKNCVLCA